MSSARKHANADRANKTYVVGSPRTNGESVPRKKVRDMAMRTSVHDAYMDSPEVVRYISGETRDPHNLAPQRLCR
jgi:hypothetical protein